MRPNYPVICLLTCLVILAGYSAAADNVVPTGDNIGYFRVLSNTNGALVYLDSSYEGQIQDGYLLIPVDVNTVAYQTYTVRAPTGELYHGYILQGPDPGRTVLLYATINQTTPQKPGVLTIISDPPGASVFIDGKPAGQVPVSGGLQFLKYQPGNYTVDLHLAGYQPYQEQVTVSPDTETTVNAIMSQNLTGTIKFISFPAGASVFLDRAFQGKTPVDKAGIIYGAHDVRMNLTGYEEWTGTVLVKPDVITPVTVRLFPLNITTVTPTPTRTKLGFPVAALMAALILTGMLFGSRRSQ